VTELRADTTANPLTAERAAQSLDYWRSTTQTLLADADPAAASAPRDAYAKLILGQANLFLNRDLSTEAEQAYQLANSLSPAQAEGVFGYTSLLLKQNRRDEARQIVQTAVNLAPDNKQFRDLLNQLSPP
jgi:tetratricopeptide (TPR) repeat protein